MWQGRASASVPQTRNYGGPAGSSPWALPIGIKIGGSRRSAWFASLQGVQTETVRVLGGVSASSESVAFMLMGRCLTLSGKHRFQGLMKNGIRSLIFIELASDRGL